MISHLYRVADAILGSALVPASVRTRLMQLWGFKIATNSCFWSGVSLGSRRIAIGSNVFVNVGFFYDGAERAVIQDNVRIGQFVRLITATHEIGPPEQRCNVEAVKKPICIETGCWIGTGVTILPGVTIRRGCVIAAGSVVTQSTECDGLYAGTPARLVRRLSGSKNVPTLLQMAKLESAAE
jgi:maltose O-acetyltransferase